MSRTEIYGFLQNDLHRIGKRIEEIFDVTFELHASYFYGSDYLMGMTKSGEDLTLIRNYNPEWSEFSEPDYEMYPLILYIGHSERIPEYIKRLEEVFRDQVTHLYTEKLKDLNT